MGGLVTRYFIEHGPPIPLSYLPANPVHNLVTIGTPELGSPLATTLLANASTPLPSNNQDPVANFLCVPLIQSTGSCTLGGLFASMGRTVGTGIASLVPGNQPTGSEPYYAVEGSAPESSFPPLPGSCTELVLDDLLVDFVPGQSDYGILGGYPNDTIVPGSSQSYGSQQMAPISGVVHTSLCRGIDTGETVSPAVWTQVAYWLLGGSGVAP